MSEVKPLSLSSAIRLGAMLKPQGNGLTTSARGTCALGAALDAVGRLCDPLKDGWWPVYEIWPIARERVTYPGVRHRDEPMILGSACWILNDSEGWTREQIADWVESIEQQQASVPDPDPQGVEVEAR